MKAEYRDLPPGRYRHYKGNDYEVIGIARDSETGTFCGLPLSVRRPFPMGKAPVPGVFNFKIEDAIKRSPA